MNDFVAAMLADKIIPAEAGPRWDRLLNFIEGGAELPEAEFLKWTEIGALQKINGKWTLALSCDINDGGQVAIELALTEATYNGYLRREART